MIISNVDFLDKQKTAYDRRISDWSSDVCSSDLGSQRYITSERQTRRKCCLDALFGRVGEHTLHAWIVLIFGQPRHRAMHSGIAAGMVVAPPLFQCARMDLAIGRKSHRHRRETVRLAGRRPPEDIAFGLCQAAAGYEEWVVGGS